MTHPLHSICPPTAAAKISRRVRFGGFNYAESSSDGQDSGSDASGGGKAARGRRQKGKGKEKKAAAKKESGGKLVPACGCLPRPHGLACRNPQTPLFDLLSPTSCHTLLHPAPHCATLPHPAEGSDYEMSEEEADEDEENECDRCKTRQSEAWCTHPATGKHACRAAPVGRQLCGCCLYLFFGYGEQAVVLPAGRAWLSCSALPVPA